MNQLTEKYINADVMRTCSKFEAIKLGTRQVPKVTPYPSAEFLSFSIERKCYAQMLAANLGAFGRHFYASIPLLLEEQIRIALAIFALSSERKENLKVYETESQDASNMRTLAQFSNGCISTLACGVHNVSQTEFNRLNLSKTAFFLQKYFCEIDKAELKSCGFLNFSNGFDIIYENVTFQFYDNNRNEQIAFLKKLLLPKGIFICTEKCLHENETEYQERETAKDQVFKSRFFNPEEIVWKEEEILTQLEYEVKTTHLIAALHNNFSFVKFIWSATNFYTYVASDDKEKLDEFCEKMGPVYAPQILCFDKSILNGAIDV